MWIISLIFVQFYWERDLPILVIKSKRQQASWKEIKGNNRLLFSLLIFVVIFIDFHHWFSSSFSNANVKFVHLCCMRKKNLPNCRYWAWFDEGKGIFLIIISHIYFIKIDASERFLKRNKIHYLFRLGIAAHLMRFSPWTQKKDEST